LVSALAIEGQPLIPDAVVSVTAQNTSTNRVRDHGLFTSEGLHAIRQQQTTQISH
jgi:hypothetical protein